MYQKKSQNGIAEHLNEILKNQNKIFDEIASGQDRKIPHSITELELSENIHPKPIKKESLGRKIFKKLSIFFPPLKW